MAWGNFMFGGEILEQNSGTESGLPWREGPPDPLLLLLFSHYVQFFATPWTTVCQAFLSFTIFQSWLKFMSIESMTLSNHLILCHPPLLFSSIFPSIRVFCNESALLIRWSKYWSFRISPSNEYSGLISFRVDWFDLLAVQETLQSLLQHHSSKASIFQCSAFFMVQISHPSIPDYWKNHSFDYVREGLTMSDLWWQNDVSAFYCAV